MAKDDFINKEIAAFEFYIIDAVTKNDKDELHRHLRFFAKEIERETRHTAVNLAQKLANDIGNL